MFLCVKNADVYSPGHLGKRDILICNDRIIAIEPQMEALPQDVYKRQALYCPVRLLFPDL